LALLSRRRLFRQSPQARFFHHCRQSFEPGENAQEAAVLFKYLVAHVPTRNLRARRKSVVALWCIALVTSTLVFVSSAPAELIATFQPQPISSTLTDVIWNQGQLYQGPGAIGTNYNYGAGDGQLPVDQQMPPGLTIETPFVVSGLPGGTIDSGNNSTTFDDATLLILPTGSNIYGLPAVGSAQSPGAGLFYQQLGGGNIQIWTTDLTAPVNGSYQGTLLLGGSITNAVIDGLVGSGAGSVVSANITFTSGAILDVAEGLPIGSTSVTAQSGQMSWSLVNASPAFSVTGGILAPFQAQATGQFNATVVPEPALAMEVLSGCALALLAGWQLQQRRKRGRGAMARQGAVAGLA
jgi:hypothetical protein